MIDQWLALGMLACMLGVAIAYDMAIRRIPNWLVVSALVVAVVFSAFTTEPTIDLSGVAVGFGQSFLGAVTGLVIMLPLYFLRAMGAGDAKLMAAVGAFLGPVQVVGTALLVFVAGGVLSLAVALWSGTLMRVGKNLRRMGMIALSDRSSGLSMRDAQTTGRLPYALAIATGTGLQIWLATQEGWPFK